MLSRKHYKMIASAIRESDIPPKEHNLLVNKLCCEFRRDNPAFSRTRFVEACEPQRVTVTISADFQKQLDGIQE